MAFPKSSKSALFALVTAGGVWAWQNRDKVAAWAGQISQQTTHRKSFDQAQTSPSSTYSGDSATPYSGGSNAPYSGTSNTPYTGGTSNTPYTGGTQRIGDEANEI